MLPDTSTGRLGRRVLKRFLYAQMALRDGLFILLGKTQPSLPFTVKAEPSSVYFNFRIRSDALAEFQQYINLAPGFELTPITCLAGEEPSHVLTLNVYEVSGLAKGLRAEWSTYVADAEGVPRYMVLEARSSEYSMDPVDVITPKGRVEHRMDTNQLQTVVASNDDALFRSTLTLRNSHPHAQIATQWIAANDFIYWRNGICDRTYYDANMIAVAVNNIPTEDVEIQDDTHWSAWVEPEPMHVLRYLGPLNFMISPWFNV